MFWYSLLAVLAVLFLLSVALPVPRRIWAFSSDHARSTSGCGCLDAMRLRRLWFAITGKGAKYVRGSRARCCSACCARTWARRSSSSARSSRRRSGMFPDAYVKEFQKVLDRVKPFPFEDVKRTLDRGARRREGRAPRRHRAQAARLRVDRAGPHREAARRHARSSSRSSAPASSRAAWPT